MFGLGLKSKLFCKIINWLMKIMTHCAKKDADSTAKNTPNTPKFIWPILPFGPKVWDINEKRLHRASVVRVSEYGAKFSTRHGNPAILHHLSIKGVVTHGNMTHHAIYNQIKTIIMKSHFNLLRRFRIFHSKWSFRVAKSFCDIAGCT